MLFAPRFRPGILDGSITLTFRRWKRAQAIAGRRYRTPAGMLEVEAVDVVDATRISDQEARRAGFESAAAVRAALRGDPGEPVYRVQFHPVLEPDPRDELAHDAALSAEDVAEIDRRLARLDRVSSYGPWTAETLAIIAERPAVRAVELAASLGRERAPFKLDVRKLKALGLTISLEKGYRLSPRGEAYRAASPPARGDDRRDHDGSRRGGDQSRSGSPDVDRAAAALPAAGLRAAGQPAPDRTAAERRRAVASGRVRHLIDRSALRTSTAAG